MFTYIRYILFLIMNRRKAIQIAALISQTINVIIFNGHEDQTVSARCYENREDKLWGRGYRFLNWIFYLISKQPDHCFDSWVRDKIRAEELLEKLKTDSGS